MDFMRKMYLYIVNSFRSPITDQELEEAASKIRKVESRNFDTDTRSMAGACWIVYPGLIERRKSSCTPNMTQQECRLLAAQVGGVAQPVIPKSQCHNSD